MKWSLFSWKKPAELAPGDYQQVKTNVNNNTTSITNLQTEVNNVKANYLTTNTAQTITSLKTFRAGPVGLKLQQAAGRSDKQYITFNDSNNTTTFSLGSQLTETSFEANRGNIRFQTQEAGKKVIFDTPEVEFNRAVPQFGTEIKAGYGAGLVKFLPEDNSTKTLQFFETNNTSQRRFNLKVAEPTEATNPATKNYVDTTNNGTWTILNDTRNTLTEVDNRSLTNQTEINNIKSTYATQRYVGGEITQVRLDLADSVVQKRDYVFTSQSSTPTALGEIYQYSLGITDLQETAVLGVNVNFKDQSDAATKATYWNVSWVCTWGSKIYIKIFVDKFLYNGVGSSYMNLDFSKLSVRVFYIPKYNARESEKIYQGEVIKLPEIKGGK